MIVEKIVEREVVKFKNNEEVLKQILNLTHVAEFFKDLSKRDESYGVTPTDFQTIIDFYQKIILFSPSAKFGSIENILKDSLKELDRYLNKDGGFALSNKKYKEIFEFVEVIAKN